MKEILTFEFMINLFRQVQIWTFQNIPEGLVPWSQATFLLAVIMVPIVVSAYISAKIDSSRWKTNTKSDNVEDLHSPKIEDPMSMIRAFECIKEWTKDYGIKWENVRLTYRENPANIFARFYLPTISLTNEEIDSFLNGKLRDFDFEGLFLAKLWLGSTRGTLNVFRAFEGGTCIDALIKTDRKKDQMLREIKRLEALLGNDRKPGPPDFLDILIQSQATLFRLIKTFFVTRPRARQNPPPKPDFHPDFHELKRP